MKTLLDPDRALTDGLAAIRAAHQVPTAFPSAVLAEAEAAARQTPSEHADWTQVPFVTLDPASATDLDQALAIEAADGDLLLHYAIADVAWFVADGGAIPGLDVVSRIPGLVRSVTTPEFAGITFHEVLAKSVLNEVPESSAMPFRFTVNAFRGCSHACAYCYARGSHTWLYLGPGDDFDRLLRDTVAATYPPHEHDEFLAHFRGLVGLWASEQVPTPG